jgi:hypothetical protein
VAILHFCLCILNLPFYVGYVWPGHGTENIPTNQNEAHLQEDDNGEKVEENILTHHKFPIG